MPGIDHPEIVAAGDEHQRAVELVHFVEKDGDIHGARFGHLVVVAPRAIVLMPLPDVAVEGHLAVDLELVHVYGLAEELHDRPDHARVARKPGERAAVQMCGEIGAYRFAILLAHIFRAALGKQARHLVAQHLHFCTREKAREEKVPVALEALDLLRCQSHVASFASWPPLRETCSRRNAPG